MEANVSLSPNSQVELLSFYSNKHPNLAGKRFTSVVVSKLRFGILQVLLRELFIIVSEMSRFQFLFTITGSKCRRPTTTDSGRASQQPTKQQ